MKKLLFILVLLAPVMVRADDPNLVDMTELTAVASSDILYIIDDPAGTPLDRKITALNLFDLIDTAAELETVANLGAFFSDYADDANASAMRTTLGLAIGTNVEAYDPNLTAIAGLTTAANKAIYWTGAGTAALYDLSAFGRTLVDDAAASNARTTLGLVIGTNVEAYDPNLTAIAGLTTAANKAIYWTGAGTADLYDLSAFGRTLVDDAAASNARTTLGLVIGTDVEACDPNLTAIAGLTTAANKAIYWTAAGTADLYDLTAFGRSLVDDAAASNARTTLGLVIGTDVEACDPNLTAIAGLTTDADKAIYWSAAGTAALYDLGSDMRTWLGTPSSANLASAVSDETGSDELVFADTPTLDTPDVNDYITIQDDGAPGDTTNKLYSNSGVLYYDGVSLEAGAGGGDAWGDAVDANIVPATDDANDLGDATHQFQDLFLDGIAYLDAIQIDGADASPATAGSILYDNVVAGIHDGALAMYKVDGVSYIIDVNSTYLPGAGEDDYVLAYDADANEYYWKEDADSGGSTAYDDIGDPDAAGSISFDAAEGGTYTSGDDEWVGITISNTQADITADSELLTLAFTDDGDPNGHYLIMSDAGSTQQLEFVQNGADVQVTTTGDLKFIAGGGDFNFADDNVTTTGTVQGGTISDGTASMNSGSLTSVVGVDASGTISANLFTPDAADGADIGSADLEFSDIYLADGSIIKGQNDQSNTITSSATDWTFALDITVSGGNINTGNIAFVVGDATTDSIQLLTDGTGDAEIALPNDSIGPDEMASGAYDLGTSLEADTLTEGGNAVYNSTETPGGELGGTWASPTVDDTGITLTSITIGSLLGVDSIDATGAVDMDYGSVDITDHNFVTDDCIVKIDGGITISTGDTLTIGSTKWDNGSDAIDGEQIADDTIDNDSIDWGDMTDLTTDGAVSWGNLAEGELADSTIVSGDIKDGTIATADIGTDQIDPNHIADDDWGFFTMSGGAATLDADTVDPNHIADDDWGDFTISGGAASLDSDVVDTEEIADDAVDPNHIKWGDYTDLGESGTVTWGNLAEGELADSTIVTADIKDGEVAAADLNATLDLSGKTITLPARPATLAHHFIVNLWNPNLLYDDDTQICVCPKLPGAITVTNIEVTCDADPDTEIQLDLKWADAFIGLANAAVIDELDTTNGAASIAAGFDDADIASGKCIYLEWQADPDAALTQVCVDITYDYD